MISSSRILPFATSSPSVPVLAVHRSAMTIVASGLRLHGTGLVGERGMYGYRYDSGTGRRVINPEQAVIVRRVFGDFAGGGSIMEVKRTDEGASGLLKGVTPHDLERFEGKFSHHCTNIGMTTCT